MTNIRSQAVVVVATALFASAAAAAPAKPITLALRLPKKPVVAAPQLAPLLAAGPLALVLVDARGVEFPELVGAQRTKGTDVYVWRSTQPIAPAVAAMASQILAGWSVRTVPDADLTLNLSMMKYDVNERSDTFGSTYIAEVRLMVSLTDRAQGVLWTGEATGQSKEPGVDARSAMCNSVLSKALRSALAQALSSMTLDTAPPSVPAPAEAAQVVAPPIAIEPEALLADLTRLLAGGVTQDVLVAYIEQRKLTRPLSVDEILQWKNAGIPDAAIRAATRP
jgi:hypothetical protein